MNHPTREEFEALKHRFEQLERETEPMRLERRLSIPEANTLQTIMDMVARQGPDIASLKISAEKMAARLDKIEETMATKDDLKTLKADMEKRFDAIAEVQRQILERLPTS